MFSGIDPSINNAVFCGAGSGYGRVLSRVLYSLKTLVTHNKLYNMLLFFYSKGAGASASGARAERLASLLKSCVSATVI